MVTYSGGREYTGRRVYKHNKKGLQSRIEDAKKQEGCHTTDNREWKG
jgi:hypothetical protein